jgi:hypothetical protein
LGATLRRNEETHQGLPVSGLHLLENLPHPDSQLRRHRNGVGGLVSARREPPPVGPWRGW